jgi:hypothetical protein
VLAMTDWRSLILLSWGFEEGWGNFLLIATTVKGEGKP